MSLTRQTNEPLSELGKIRARMTEQGMSAKFPTWKTIDPDVKQRLLDELGQLFPEPSDIRITKTDPFMYSIEMAEALAARSLWLQALAIVNK